MTLSAKQFWWPKLTEAIQRKCDNCIPCKFSGKNIKLNIPKTEQNSLPPLSVPNEEIQLDFVGPISNQNRRFYILLSMDRYSKWPAASLCKTTDGETATKFLEQYCNLNDIPKTIKTDKATAFTGRRFRNFCRNKFIKIVYGTPYIHTPTGLVEGGVRTLKENLLANIKAGEPFAKFFEPLQQMDVKKSQMVLAFIFFGTVTLFKFLIFVWYKVFAINIYQTFCFNNIRILEVEV